MIYSALLSITLYATGAMIAYSLWHTIKNKNYAQMKLVAGGGGGGGGKGEAPQQPAPPPPPPPPPTEDAEVVRQKGEQERRRAAAAKGYSATDLTNGVFASGNSTDVKKPTLLGGS